MEKQPESRTEWTILKLLNWTSNYFKSHNIDSPRSAAEILLAHALKISRIDLYLRYDQPLLSEELAEFKKLIKRRINREPVAYIVGIKEFWSMDFNVTKDVLIPRPDTESLVEAAITEISHRSAKTEDTQHPLRILDAGAGSGAIILAVAANNPDHAYFAIDTSFKALRIARKNAAHHNLDRKVRFFCGNWLTSLNPAVPLFDLILSNPPYIPTDTISGLMPEISKYEPKSALDGGSNGLESFSQIICNAHKHLKPHGAVILEIGHNQKEQVRKIIVDSAHYKDIMFIKDYSGHDRVVKIRLK
jgi:release factor glutamine methyltransferase